MYTEVELNWRESKEKRKIETATVRENLTGRTSVVGGPEIRWHRNDS